MMRLDKDRINFIVTIVLIIILIQLYYDGKLACILDPIEKMYSWVHYTTSRILSEPIVKLNIFNNAENYSPCSPYDCTRYRIRKDQMLVRNPFKWPWSGSEFPQYAVQYDEVNKTASQRFAPRKCWGSKMTPTCGNMMDNHRIGCGCRKPLTNVDIGSPYTF